MSGGNRQQRVFNPVTVEPMYIYISLSLSSALNPCPYVRETRAMVAHLQPDVAKYIRRPLAKGERA